MNSLHLGVACEVFKTLALRVDAVVIDDIIVQSSAKKTLRDLGLSI